MDIKRNGAKRAGESLMDERRAGRKWIEVEPLEAEPRELMLVST